MPIEVIKLFRALVILYTIIIVLLFYVTKTKLT